MQNAGRSPSCHVFLFCKCILPTDNCLPEKVQIPQEPPGKFQNQSIPCTVGNRALDRIILSAELSNDDEYICAQKRQLIVKHELTILALQEAPCFILKRLHV